MSAGPQPFFGRTQDQALLGELLHSLTQPLTTLRCSLELSVEDVAGQQHDAVTAALEQTDRDIEVVRLMQEYLETETSTAPQTPVPQGPVLRSVIDHLLPKAVERLIRVHLTGGVQLHRRLTGAAAATGSAISDRRPHRRTTTKPGHHASA